MFLRTAENKTWCLTFSFILLGLVAGYLWYGYDQYPHGGSWPGIISGAVGSIGMGVLMFYSLIKRHFQRSRGNLQTWLYCHIWLGTLVFFLILFHSGFHFKDITAVSAMILLTVVVASGVIGVLLYDAIPPKFIYIEANKSTAELSEEMNGIVESMVSLASRKSAAFRKLADRLIAAEQPQSNARWRILFTYHPRRRRPMESFDVNDFTGSVDATETEDLKRLVDLAGELRRLHEQLIDKQRYVNVMSAWLYVHVPISFLLLLVVVVHIAAVLHYRFW